LSALYRPRVGAAASGRRSIPVDAARGRGLATRKADERCADDKDATNEDATNENAPEENTLKKRLCDNHAAVHTGR
jgi:hypothetical protein